MKTGVSYTGGFNALLFRFNRCALIFLCIIQASLGIQAGNKSVTPVTLQLKWTHAFQFAGYYAALENGYYRGAGLDLKILSGGPNVDVTAQVVSGKADFGVGTSGLLLDYAAGKPVKVLGVVYQHSPMTLIMRTDKPSATVEGLKGRTVMIESHAADVLAMFRRLGVPLSSMNCVNHTGRTEDLLKYDAYAVTAYLTNEPFVLDKLGIEYFMLSPRAYGIDFYGDNFFTSRKLYEKNEALVNAFCVATVRGWQYALNHPEKMVDLILAKYPTEMSREHLIYEADRTRDLMTNLVAPGYMLRGRWEHIADTYIDLGMLEERPDLDDFLLLPDSPGLPYWFTDAVLGVGLLFFAMLTILLLLRNRNLDLKRRVAAQSAQEIQYHREELLLRLKLQKVLIRDIHDGLGSLTTNLSFASVLARNEKEITKKNEWLEKIERLVSEANMEVRDLMNTLEENSTRWPDLIETIRRSSEAILDYKSTTVRFHIAGVPVEEDIGLAEGLSLVRIVREGMNNIVKYSGASLVEIGMESSVDNVRITIKDNGCGFDPETVRRGRGLNNLAARTAELGGRFEIISGNGTQLEFIFPRPIRIDKQEMSAVSAGNPVSEVKQLAIRAAKGVSNEFNHS